MAKRSYKVPTGLNQSFLDMEISIKSSGGIGFKPLPLRVVLFWVGSLLLGLFIVLRTPVGYSVPRGIIFAIAWLVTTFILAKSDKTKQMQIQRIPVFLSYLPRSARRLFVRKSLNNGNNILGLSLLDDIDPKTGMITFSDDSYGYLYRVVGSASILLFDKDRDDIIDRVDNFYRKIGTECELIFITSKEAQQIYRQVYNLKKTYMNLDTDDADLKNLAEEQFYILKNYIGGSFRSIHQYMVCKSDNKEMLIRNHNIIQSEYENSTLMFKQCTKLGFSDICSVFKSIYS